MGTLDTTPGDGDAPPAHVATPGTAANPGESLLAFEGDLKPFLLNPDDTTREALHRLRLNGHGVAAVVDSGGRVVGTLTDANIRRAVLDGGTLDARVGDVMSAKPVTTNAAAGEDEVLELMHAHRLRGVPVIEDQLLVGLHLLRGCPQMQAAPIAVIMAGGRGERLRPMTDKVPKPLLKLGSRSIVERIISAMVPAGVRQVYLAINYLADAFQQRLGSGHHLGVAIDYLREEQAMGTAGALALLPAGQSGPIIVSNGDIVTTVDFARLLDFHWRHGGAVTVAGVEHVSHIPYGVLRAAQHHLLAIEEKPERRDLCSAGIYVLEPEVLGFLARGTRFDMPDLIAQVLAEGLPVHVFPVLEKWFDIGGTAEFERMLIQFATGEED